MSAGFDGVDPQRLADAFLVELALTGSQELRDQVVDTLWALDGRGGPLTRASCAHRDELVAVTHRALEVATG